MASLNEGLIEKEDILKAASEIHRIFIGSGSTLSVAESCTGGLVCHYLTALPGASAFFETGIVAYSVKVKIRLLGLAPEIIKKYGVISMETARAMAEKMAALAETSCALSTTGNLGPGALEDKDTGLIFFAVCKGPQTFAREVRLSGGRSENKKIAALMAMNFLIEVLNGKTG